MFGVYIRGNYVFLDSQESLIKEFFEKKKSPFYHFGMLFPLAKIPERELKAYLSSVLKGISPDHARLADGVLRIAEVEQPGSKLNNLAAS